MKHGNNFFNENWNKAADYFNLQEGYVMHHKDVTLKEKDPERYNEWRVEDLEVMSRSEHTAYHNKLRRGKYHWHLSEETKRKMSENNVGSKGMHWFNNGVTDLFAYECPDGYVKGRLRGKNPYRDLKGRYTIKETMK